VAEGQAEGEEEVVGKAAVRARGICLRMRRLPGKFAPLEAPTPEGKEAMKLAGPVEERAASEGEGARSEANRDRLRSGDQRELLECPICTEIMFPPIYMVRSRDVCRQHCGLLTV